jgi:chromosome partitioning protein
MTIITVAQQKGGAGKSTLTANLAVTFVQMGKKVAIIDIDPQKSLTMWHEIRTKKYGEGFTGITFANISGWRVTSEISRFVNDHDIILIDSPPQIETDAKTAIKYADLILIPVQPSPTDIWATKPTIDLARQEKKPVFTVLNRVPNNSLLAKKLENQLVNLLKTRIGNRVTFASSMIDGKTVIEVDPKSTAAEEIKDLAKELLQVIQKEFVENSKELATS